MIFMAEVSRVTNEGDARWQFRFRARSWKDAESTGLKVDKLLDEVALDDDEGEEWKRLL